MLTLFTNARAVGVIEVLDTRPRDFVEAALEARTLAQVAAHTLDKALLLRQLEQRNR